MNERIRMFEELAANAHVALNVMQYDGWLLRFSEGHTSRVNSVSPIYPSTLNENEKIDFCEKEYKKQNLPCIFKLTDEDSDLKEILYKRGYKDVTPSDVMTLKIDNIKMPKGDLVFFDKPQEEWLKPYFSFEGFDERKQSIYRRMLDKVVVDTKYVAIKENGEIVATASSATERGYMLIQNVIVSPEHRRKGYGKAVCEALLAKAKEAGTKNAWLQVLQDNEAAHTLYEGLGFEKEYGYVYLKK